MAGRGRAFRGERELAEIDAHIGRAAAGLGMTAFLGEEADGRELLGPVRALGPRIDTCATAPPSVLADLAMDPRDPLPFISAHQLLGALPASAVDDLVAAAGAGAGSPLEMVQLRHMGGALARRAPGAGARATLPGEVSVFSAGVAPGAASASAVRDALAAVGEAVSAHLVGHYPNFVERPADASAFFDAGDWERLRRIKALYDPLDLFRGNHHSRPRGVPEPPWPAGAAAGGAPRAGARRPGAPRR